MPSWCNIHSGQAGIAVQVTNTAKVGNSTIGSSPSGLFVADKLTTNSSGHLRFCLKAKQTLCDTHENSALQVHPNGGSRRSIVVKFTKGSSQCSTSLMGSRSYATGTALMRVNDAVWSVALSDRRTIVGVARGFVGVSGISGPTRAVIVGPAKQTIVPAGGDPGPPTPIDPSPEDEEGFAFLRHFLRTPSFGPPRGSDSPTLLRIFKRKVAVVGYDTEGAAKRGVAPFMKLFFGFLTRSWKVKLELVSLTPEQARQQLAGNNLDLFASPHPFGPAAFPFFTVPKGATWQLGDGSDAAFDAAVSSFLKDALAGGQFDALFRKAFHVEPSYSGLRGLLFTP